LRGPEIPLLELGFAHFCLALGSTFWDMLGEIKCLCEDRITIVQQGITSFSQIFLFSAAADLELIFFS